MNTTLYKEIIASRNLGVGADHHSDVTSKYSPQEIRETVSALVAEDRSDLAHALAEAGVSLYPDSEDILAIAGLMAMLREDWVEAASMLNHLLEIQGERAPLNTHLMFIRALRCALEPAAALSAVMLAHEHYPNHPELEREFESLSALLGLTAAD